jgi:hypothetical protein
MHILHAKELTMRTDLKLATTHLKRGQLLRLDDAAGTLVLCLGGTLWLTQQGDRRDIVLEAGGEARIEHDGVSIVSALSDADLVWSRDSVPRDLRPHDADGPHAGVRLTAPDPSARPAAAAT